MEDVRYPVRQGRVQLSLCLTEHHAMKTYEEWRCSSTHP